jgi:hypothetical protein
MVFPESRLHDKSATGPEATPARRVELWPAEKAGDDLRVKNRRRQVRMDGSVRRLTEVVSALRLDWKETVMVQQSPLERHPAARRA